ncbi:hypothetical protein B0T13DRAFT_112431 [Neurospora crassa]|nr:hypothetical protein B0T13DRAFT_112431 [Neurospora crassa]
MSWQKRQFQSSEPFLRYGSSVFASGWEAVALPKLTKLIEPKLGRHVFLCLSGFESSFLLLRGLPRSARSSSISASDSRMFRSAAEVEYRDGNLGHGQQPEGDNLVFQTSTYESLTNAVKSAVTTTDSSSFSLHEVWYSHLRFDKSRPKGLNVQCQASREPTSCVPLYPLICLSTFQAHDLRSMTHPAPAYLSYDEYRTYIPAVTTCHNLTRV